MSLKVLNSKSIKEWFFKTGVRCLKTFCETAISMITVGQAFSDVTWLHVLSVSGVAAVVCFMTCIVNIPEVEARE